MKCVNLLTDLSLFLAEGTIVRLLEKFFAQFDFPISKCAVLISEIAQLCLELVARFATKQTRECRMAVQDRFVHRVAVLSKCVDPGFDLFLFIPKLRFGLGIASRLEQTPANLMAPLLESPLFLKQCAVFPEKLIPGNKLEERVARRRSILYLITKLKDFGPKTLVGSKRTD
jgi:hypothetical protein